MKLGLLIALSLIISLGFAQEEEEKKYELSCIAFYNVENLFDTIDQEDVVDEEFLPNSKKQWNSERYFDKIKKMSETMAAVGADKTGEPPAIFGICEVENRSVIEDLAASNALKDYNYQIEHHDCYYFRGVDCGFMYRPEYFTVSNTESYELRFPDKPDLTTRDQLLVSGTFMGETMHFIVLHYPSRRGGEKRSRPLRIQAAELTMHIVDSLLEIDPNNKIIIMGDLNDDPTNKSVKKVLNSHGKKKKLKEGELFNPMADLFKQGIGSLAYRDTWNLFDMILMTPSLVDDDYTDLTFHRAVVFNKSFLLQKDGRFKGYPFRTFVGNTYMGGYSDHFPSYIYLIRELQD